MDSHVTRTMPYWKTFFSKPIGERIFIAPKEVIEYIDLDNRKHGLPNKPVAPSASNEFLQDIRTAVKEIPESIKNLLDAKFAGIFLINDLGGSGYTDYILNEKGEPVASFVVLDVSVLQKRNANEWATWKEQTPFKKDAGFELEVKIEDNINDNRKSAIQYILLHELGHVISVNEFFHPPWEVDPDSLKNVERYAFFNESWKIDGAQNRFVSRFDSTFFADRTNVVYYFGAKLNNDQMIGVYDKLEKTDFVTLYAATNPGDDWAESFVTYVHGVLMKKPFQLTIKRNGKVEKTFGLCWGTVRCSKKEAVLSKLFSRH